MDSHFIEETITITMGNYTLKVKFAAAANASYHGIKVPYDTYHGIKVPLL